MVAQNKPNQPKFKLGQIVLTKGAISVLQDSDELPSKFLKRHMSGDWGDVCESDGKLNDEAVANEGDIEKQMRVLSSYKTSKGVVIWVISEFDRSLTTILLPSEY